MWYGGDVEGVLVNQIILVMVVAIYLGVLQLADGEQLYAK